MLSKEEARELIRQALAMHDAQRPVPSYVSTKQAAEMLGVSPRTVMRMNLPKNAAGKIHYDAVLEARASR